MTQRRLRRPAPPLDEAKLRELALAYVGRFATTRAKLRTYLARKIRERGWAGTDEPDLQALADAIAGRGYVDDSAYALTKAQSLSGRGYGARRIMEKLRAAGVKEADGKAARDHAQAATVAAALRYAERRRIGPYATQTQSPEGREKALGAMIRAGHPFAIARAVIDLPAGEAVDHDELCARWGIAAI